MSMKTSRLVLLRQILLELLDLGAFAADDDARTRSADGDPQLVARAVDFDRADPADLSRSVRSSSARGLPAAACVPCLANQRERQVLLKPSRNPYG
jgi:hypothetical protein